MYVLMSAQHFWLLIFVNVMFFTEWEKRKFFVKFSEQALGHRPMFLSYCRINFAKILWAAIFEKGFASEHCLYKNFFDNEWATCFNQYLNISCNLLNVILYLSDQCDTNLMMNNLPHYY